MCQVCRSPCMGWDHFSMYKAGSGYSSVYGRQRNSPISSKGDCEAGFLPRMCRHPLWPLVCCRGSQGALERALLISFLMARVKWETMTDESQAMVKKVGLISIGGVILLAFSKMIFPLILLGGGGYVAWRALNKKWVIDKVNSKNKNLDSWKETSAYRLTQFGCKILCSLGFLQWLQRVRNNSLLIV